jgi:hypothetical protein
MSPSTWSALAGDIHRRDRLGITARALLLALVGLKRSRDIAQDKLDGLEEGPLRAVAGVLGTERLVIVRLAAKLLGCGQLTSVCVSFLRAASFRLSGSGSAEDSGTGSNPVWALPGFLAKRIWLRQATQPLREPPEPGGVPTSVPHRFGALIQRSKLDAISKSSQSSPSDRTLCSTIASVHSHTICEDWTRSSKLVSSSTGTS